MGDLVHGIAVQADGAAMAHAIPAALGANAVTFEAVTDKQLFREAGHGF